MQHPDRRATCAGWVAVALALLSGCQGSATPGPDDSTPAAAPTTGPYNKEERTLYREAVRRLHAFEVRNQELLGAGRATEESRRFYRRHVRGWQESFALLEWFDRNGIQVVRGPAVLATEAASIKSFQDNAAEIVLRRCVDQSRQRVLRDGSPMPVAHAGPVVQQVVVHRYENSTWSVGTVDTTDEPCAG